MKLTHFRKGFLKQAQQYATDVDLIYPEFEEEKKNIPRWQQEAGLYPQKGAVDASKRIGDYATVDGRGDKY